MGILQNEPLLLKIFSYMFYTGLAAFVVSCAAEIIITLKNKKKSNAPSNLYKGDLLSYPKKKIVKPIVPKTVSYIGVFGFICVFGMCGKLLIDTDMAVIPTLIISFFISVAAQIALTLMKYAFDLKNKSNLIFVPNLINMKGVVVSDIPADQMGLGEIRLACENGVTQIRAKSMDEVALTKSTKVNVLYADSDRVVVVERLVEEKTK